MDFADQLRVLAGRVAERKDSVQTEEATKNAFIMPFIQQVLGYDVFDPSEVVPEFVADVGSRRGEKIDYAILIDSKPALLIECKSIGIPLENEQAGQLRRYFHVVDARIGILTNGVRYMFFADLDKPNIMDDKPFMELDMLDLNEQLFPELKKLCKASFELDAMISAASDLKSMRQIKAYLERQITGPDVDFVRLVLSQFYDGMKTQQVIEQFTPLIQRALSEVINDRIHARLKSAMDVATPSLMQSEAPAGDVSNEDAHSEENDNGVITTPEEIEGYYIVRAIMRSVVAVDRVVMRDTKTYCGILLDDNNRKPICRLRFNSTQKYLGLIGPNKEETKVAIDGLNAIYDHADALRATIGYYESARSNSCSPAINQE